MNDLILDAGVAASACLPGTQSGEVEHLLQKARRSEVKLWLYMGQIGEILSQIEAQLSKTSVQNGPDIARNLLMNLATDCSWLAALSEDASGLDDPDPLAIGLTRAAARLGAEALVVTELVSRLERGHPFEDIKAAITGVRLDITVPFIDLASQQDRIRPTLERNLHRVLYHGRYVMGTEIEKLELRLADYVGVEHCICVSSGTDALLIAMMSLEIGPGDEVITTPFTFFAAVEAIRLLGAKPVYVDIDPRVYTLDPIHLEDAITDRTRAILPVSLYGQCAAMDRINEIAAVHEIPVLEDAAQSFGATYEGRHSCGLSQIGCTSFFPAKPLGAYGDAGACFTPDSSLADRIREIRDHGQSGRYQHVRIGINGRMDTLQAAVLHAKLDIFDDELQSRVRAAEKYSSLLKESEVAGKLQLPQLEPHNFSSWAQYTIEVNDRSYVQPGLAKKGIPTSVHYPIPVYEQPALDEAVAHCPNTEKAAQRVLSLPMHPYLHPETQEFIAENLIEAIS